MLTLKSPLLEPRVQTYYIPTLYSETIIYSLNPCEGNYFFSDYYYQGMSGKVSHVNFFFLLHKCRQSYPLTETVKMLNYLLKYRQNQ